MTKKIMDRVLWLAVEDYSGLWEVIWELHSYFPHLSKMDRDLKAMEAVRDLYARGWIELYRCSEPDGKLETVPYDELDAILKEPANWQEPAPGSTSIRIGATSTGEKELVGKR